MQTLYEHFLASQDIKPVSKALYCRALRPFSKWMHQNGFAPLQAQQVTLLAYKTFLHNQGLSVLTISVYLCAVRRFYAWAAQQGLCADVANGLKTPKKRQQFRKSPLNPQQAKKLLEYAEKLNERDFSLLNLLLRTGLRTIEAARANVGDITWKSDKRVLLVQGKGHDEKDSFVVLTDKTYLPLSHYLATRPNAHPTEPLFVSQSANSMHQRLSTRSISAIAKRALQGINLDAKQFTAHSLRHTAAVNILRAGGSIYDAQGMLRHQNPATTQIYTGIIEEELRLKHSPEALIDTII